MDSVSIAQQEGINYMNASERIDQLEKHIKDAQEELTRLRAEITGEVEPDLTLPMGGDGWIVADSGRVVSSSWPWPSKFWVFKSEAEAEWTLRHERAWRKLRFCADKLNPKGWVPISGIQYYLLSSPEHTSPTIVGSSKSLLVMFSELVPFISKEAAERALKELGDDVNYLWSWNRRPEEKAR